jgi:hypothetical protein
VVKQHLAWWSQGWVTAWEHQSRMVVSLSNVFIGPDGAPAPSVSQWVCWTKIYIHAWTLNRSTHFDPEDGGIMYLRNVGNAAHIHTLQKSKGKFRIKSSTVTKVKEVLNAYFLECPLGTWEMAVSSSNACRRIDTCLVSRRAHWLYVPWFLIGQRSS